MAWGGGGGWNDATQNAYPDWIEVGFGGSKTINEIDVFTLQDNYTNPTEPTESQTFSLYGIRDFVVQYWDGANWQTVTGGSVTSNNKMWRKFSFANLTTEKIRVQITGSADGYSRVTEIEAYAVMSYDAAGDVVNDGLHSYTYDAENRVVSVDGGAAIYSYDHQNRRVKKVVGTTRTDYIWEGSNVIEEYNALLIGPWRAKADYVYVGGKLVSSFNYTITYGCSVNQWGVEICTTTRTATATRYYVSDRLSKRLVLDQNGNVVGRQSHLPYGEEIAPSGEGEKHKFTSYERDTETGTDYAVNRQYAQGVGRFMRVDPYKGSSEQLFPQTWNRYSYTLNDPVNATDPLGTVPTDPLAPGFSSGKRYPGWMLCWIFPRFCEPTIPGEVIRQPIQDPSGRPTVERCNVELPTDPDQLGILSIIMLEHTSLGNLGKGEYVPGHGLSRDGEVISWATLGAEAWAFASAIRNQADATNKSIRDTLRDDVYLGRRNARGRPIGGSAAARIQAGEAMARAMLLSFKGSPACTYLGIAVYAVDLSERSRNLEAGFRWWKAVIQGNRQRVNDPDEITERMGDTDFSNKP